MVSYITEDDLKAFPYSLPEASSSLGTTKLETSISGVVTAAFSSISSIAAAAAIQVILALLLIINGFAICTRNKISKKRGVNR